jgi:hypothetical protein
LELNADFLETIDRLYRRESASRSELRRIKIVLHLLGKAVHFSNTAGELGHDRETVSCWYHRAWAANLLWDELVENALKEPGHAGTELRKERLAREIFADNPRSGAPCKYSIEQYTQLVALALRPPSEYARPITHWTARELADEIRIQRIAPGISSRQVQRFLDQADLQPHRNDYWLNPKIGNRAEYESQVAEICGLYSNALELYDAGTHLVSTDEKTGIQALERIAPAKPMIPGHPEKIEFEYRRHGTLSLIPSFEVATGKIVSHHIGETRKEEDFAKHIASTIGNRREDRWIFISDQLNTHMSETLVRMVAELTGYKGELGEKDKSGVLKNLKTRREFLSDPEHRVRFVYTPKHCSWLNQVEIWFGILVRKVLKRGSFASAEILRDKIEKFIGYFNRTMAKPYKWTYKGLPLTA